MEDAGTRRIPDAETRRPGDAVTPQAAAPLVESAPPVISAPPVSASFAWLTPQRLLFALVLLVIAYFTLVPLGMLLYGSFSSARPGEPGTFTLNNYLRAYTNLGFWQSGLHTLVFSVGTTLVALALGTFLAWAVERTNTPLRGAIFVLSVVRLIVPGLLLTVAWILLLSPTSGFLNLWIKDLLRLPDMPFNLNTLPGMIWVEGVNSTPLAFLLMTAAFRSMDPALEEAARVCGANHWQTVRRVTVPLALPAALAAALIVFVNAFESFEVPALLGIAAQPQIRTFSTEVFITARRVPTDLPLSSAYSVLFLAVAGVGVLLYQRLTRAAERFATVTGKGYRPHRLDLGPWKWLSMLVCLTIVGLAFVLPIFVLAWRSLQPFHRPPSLEALRTISLRHYEFILNYPATFKSISNSLLLGGIAGTLVMLLTAVAAWMVIRSRLRGSRAVDGLTFVPIALPGLVLGLSLVWVYLNVFPVLYGTLWVLAIAYSTRFLPYGMRFSVASMTQIHEELEGAAQASGADWLQTFRRVTLPLLLPGLLSGWIFVFINSFRELSTSVLLSHIGSEVVAVAIFDLWDAGLPGPVAAFAMVTVGVLSVVVAASRIIGGRFGVKI